MAKLFSLFGHSLQMIPWFALGVFCTLFVQAQMLANNRVPLPAPLPSPLPTERCTSGETDLGNGEFFCEDGKCFFSSYSQKLRVHQNVYYTPFILEKFSFEFIDITLLKHVFNKCIDYMHKNFIQFVLAFSWFSRQYCR